MQKFFLILGVCALGAFVSLESSKKQTTVNDVVLENIEALANGEMPIPQICRSSGEVTCPFNGVKVQNVYEGYGWNPGEETY